MGVDGGGLGGDAAASPVGGERGERLVVEHWVIGGGFPVLQAGGRHAGQAVHAAIVRPKHHNRVSSSTQLSQEVH